MGKVWLVPERDGSDIVGDLKSSHLNAERIKALIAEFVGKLTLDEWLTAEYRVPKINYGSAVDARPFNRINTAEPMLWQYEVRARFDVDQDIPCLVLITERFFRSKFYGLAYREIWVTLGVLQQILNELYPDKIPDTVISRWTEVACATYKKRGQDNETIKCTIRGLNVSE